MGCTDVNAQDNPDQDFIKASNRWIDNVFHHFLIKLIINKINNFFFFSGCINLFTIVWLKFGCIRILFIK